MVSTNIGLIGQDYVGKVSIRKIVNWRLESYNLNATLDDSKVNDIQDVTGDIRGDVIFCNVRGATWEHKVIFFREPEFEKRLDQLKKAMSDANVKG